MNINGKRVLVCGMARSGIAAAKLLLSLGAQVTITDTKPEADFGGALDELRAPGCVFALGQAADALIAGQDMMIISPGIAWAKPFVQSAIAQGVEVMGELELGARLTKGALVAITGTNGKTTTTTLVGELFRAAGRTTHVVGNIGYPITATAGISKEDDVTVAEVSSYQCEGISQFHPHVGAVLNITEDHIVRHGSMAVYIAMKRRIFDRQTAQDIAVFNYDDATCREMAKGLKAQVAWFSRREKVPFGAYVEDQHIVLKLGEGEQRVCRCDEVYIPGPHNLENALAAVTIAGVMGVPCETMREVLKTFKGVEHRIETVRELDGVRWYNDSIATSPSRAMIGTLSLYDFKIVMIAGGADKKVPFDELGKVICDKVKTLVLLAPEKPLEGFKTPAAGKIEAAVRGAENYKDGAPVILHANNMKDAVRLARESAEPGDVVSLCPAATGFDMYKSFAVRGDIYREEVKALK